MLDKLAVARALREIGLLLQAKGENPFKVRAYETGARALEDSAEDLATLVQAGRLTELPGIGEALAKKIAELHLGGQTPLLERLRVELPPALLELQRVPDLGPKKLAVLQEALGIRSLAELEQACREGRVRGVKGFGEKTEQRILASLPGLRRKETRVLLSDALELGERLVHHLRAGPEERVELAGSTRRRKETVGDLDLVASAPDPSVFGPRLAAFPLTVEMLSRGEAKTAVRLASGLQVDLRTVAPEHHAGTLHHLTGSKAHHVKLRGLARGRGYSLSEHGLARLDGGATVPVVTEADLYAKLGLPFIPPELREDEGEIEAGLAGALPDDLVRLEDVRGMVHCHTRWSDGRATVEEMALAAQALGMEYLTITDHSPSAHYAGGLDADRLKAQWDEIARVQETVAVRLLRGTESDITEDGLLDFPDAVLEQLDVIVASVHSRFKMDRAAMTRRIRRALELPVFKIWGHARGRLLLEREPFDCDMDELLDALAGSRGAVEVNGDPHRLEMEPSALRQARARGLGVVLSVDAHSTGALGYLRYAVDVARRGGVRRGEVLNALPWDAFARVVRPAG